MYVSAGKVSPRPAPGLNARLQERLTAWHVAVDRVIETKGAVLAFGQRDRLPVVLKVVKQCGDEWRAGEIVHAFDGRGVVRAYEYVEGAMLLERLSPARALASVVLSGDDDAATRIIAQTIRTMSPRACPEAVPTLTDWGRSFERYLATGDRHVPRDLVTTAGEMYQALCDSQGPQRLLHGDLHHYNILFDADRGWLAVDPKGVIGEIEYELGAMLRNPYEAPAVFTDAAIIERRVESLAAELDVDMTRVLSWAFAQAVLAAIWAVEDGGRIEPHKPWLRLADALQRMSTRV